MIDVNRLKYWLCIITVVSATANAQPLSPELLKGETLFRNAGGYGCQVCHGLYAHGGNQAGGNIRGATELKLIEALSRQPTMHLLTQVLSQSEIRSISNYLQYLGNTPMVELHFKDGKWHVKEEIFQPGDLVQLVIFNESFTQQILDLSAIELGEIPVGAMETIGILWTRQKKYSSFPLLQ